MTLTARDPVDAVRLLHPAFDDRRTPRGLILRQLSQIQRLLVQKANKIDPNVVARPVSVILAFNPSDVPGNVGAGTASGLPGVAQVDGTDLTDAPAGALFELLSGDEQPILASDFVPDAATTLTIEKTGAGWTVNEFAGKVVLIPAGLGYGQVAEILSNTDEVLSLDPETPFVTAPDSTSLIRVVAGNTGAPGNVVAFTALPALRQQKGWLVKLDDQGTAYIDLDSPLVANVSQGVPLVPHLTFLGGTVRMSNPQVGPYPFELTPYGSRLNNRQNRYAGYIQGGELHLLGSEQDWFGCASIDCRLVPVPPELTALTDPLLLDEGARDALTYILAERLGRRLLEHGVSQAQFAVMQADAREFLTEWLDSIGRSSVADISFVDEVI